MKQTKRAGLWPRSFRLRSMQDVTEDWISGSKAVYVIRWNEQWPSSFLAAFQRWGDVRGCRFLLTYEGDSEAFSLGKLALYCSPKPNRKETGLCALSIQNRDRALEKFHDFLEGFLAGKGYSLGED